ncbi:MAG: hypothetical protein ACREMM_10655 [Gemmatimonadales bacterium]
MRHYVAFVALGMLSGCHTYLPLGTVEPQVGTRVSAELTSYGSDTLARYVGPDIATLRGDVVTAEDADVILSVTSVTDRFGQEKLWKRERVRVPRVAVQTFQERKFSLGRSLLLGAAFLGASVASWEAFQGGMGGALPPGGGGGEPK